MAGNKCKIIKTDEFWNILHQKEIFCTLTLYIHANYWGLIEPYHCDLQLKGKKGMSRSLIVMHGLARTTPTLCQ